MAEDTGHDAAFRRVEEEAEEDQGEEERPYRREEEEVDLVADGGAQEVMAGVISAREPRRDGGLRSRPIPFSIPSLGGNGREGAHLDDAEYDEGEEDDCTCERRAIKSGRQRSSMERS